MKEINDSPFTRIYGDINRMDAVELARVTRKSKRIIEFGIGGSSYIIHQNSSEDTKILHVETIEFWNTYVVGRLREIVPVEHYTPTNDYEFHLIDIGLDVRDLDPLVRQAMAVNTTGFDFIKACPQIEQIGSFDFVFVDGVVELRLSFAYQLWDYLEIGGSMLFHDGKTPWMAERIGYFIMKHYADIDTIKFNRNHSNIVEVIKGEYKPYYDWNYAETEDNRENPALEQGMFT